MKRTIIMLITIAVSACGTRNSFCVPQAVTINVLDQDYLESAYNRITEPGKRAYNIVLSGTVMPKKNAPDAPFVWEKSGSKSYPIRIYSTGRPKAKLTRNRQPSPKNTPILVLKNVKYVYIQNIIFEDAAAGICLLNADYCKVENCEFLINEFMATGGDGAIVLTDEAPQNCADWPASSDYNQIVSNTIQYASEASLDDPRQDEDQSDLWYNREFYHGIYVAHASHNLIQNNTIINPPGCGIHFYHDYTSFNTVSSNTIKICYHNKGGIRSLKVGTKLYSLDDDKAIDNVRHGILISHEMRPETVKNNTVSKNAIYVCQNHPNGWRDHYDAYGPGTNVVNQNSSSILMHSALKKRGNKIESNNFKLYNCNSAGAKQKTVSPGVRSLALNKTSKGRMYRFVSGEVFVIDHPATITKIENKVRAGKKNFGDKMGTQVFKNKQITALAYADGSTLVGFSDGKVLKVKGTGGSGDSMFNVTETPGGFATSDSSAAIYYQGSHQFMQGIEDIAYIDGCTFISFSRNGSYCKILKVRRSGGSGDNLFAISETRDTFSGLRGYDYYIGYDKFSGSITHIDHMNGRTYFYFDNGKTLDVNGTGGGGTNMFSVKETK